MKLNAIPPSLQTLYADFVQQVETAPIGGTVYTRDRGGSVYLYAKIPVANDRIDSFIGKAGDPIADAQATSLREGLTSAQARRTTIAMLAAGGLATPTRALGSTLDAIAHAGLFRNGAVLVGTGAYLLSEPHVGHRLPAPTQMTGDLDLATAQLTLAADPPETMQAVLRRADPTFQPILQIDPRKPASRFRNKDGFFVDLLTPIRSRTDENPRPLEALGAGAAPLQHLAWLIADPVPAVALWRAGVAVRIPAPARFAVHKLILAQRRDAANRIKRTKDLAQADAIMTALYVHDPFALEDALADARGQGKAGWADPIDRSLAEIARAN